VIERANRTFPEKLDELELTSRSEAEAALASIVTHYRYAPLGARHLLNHPVGHDQISQSVLNWVDATPYGAPAGGRSARCQAPAAPLD
jgi:hypothetical protein